MQELAVREQTTPAFSMTPRNLDEAMKFAQIMADSDLVPKDFKGKPGNILVAIQKGIEIGLTPMNALECIAVINGRPAIWGDTQLALVQASPACEWIDENESTETLGVCIVQRKGDPKPHRSEFSLEQAKRAGLLGKPGPWTQYTARMLKLRARGFALRDKFSDVLKGMISAEEAMDLPSQAPVTVETSQAPTLKDKLKAQLEGPKEEPQDIPAAALPPADTDIIILFEDLVQDINQAETVRDATAIFNGAVDKGELPRPKLDALKVILQERMAVLGKKK